MMNSVLVPVMVLVNDERNGCFIGSVDAISIEYGNDPLIFLNRVDGKGTTFRYLKDHFIKFGKLKIHIRGQVSGFGNWCWDEVAMEAKDAVRLLNYLRRCPQWDIDDSDEKFYDKWENWKEFTEEDFIELDVAK